MRDPGSLDLDDIAMTDIVDRLRDGTVSGAVDLSNLLLKAADYIENRCVDKDQHNAIVKQKNDEIERLRELTKNDGIEIGSYRKGTGLRGEIRAVEAENEKLRAVVEVAKETVAGKDRNTDSAGQVYVDEGSLQALQRALAALDSESGDPLRYGAESSTIKIDKPIDPTTTKEDK